MTFKAAERIFETSITTGVGDYTLAGAQTGYQAVSAIGANNTGPFFITDGNGWEVVIGTYITGPDRLQRTAVLASSNGGAAVNWGVGTRQIRSGWPAWLALPRVKSKSVAGGVDVALTDEECRCHILILTGLLTANINVTVDPTPWKWTVIDRTTGNFGITFKTTAGAGVAIGKSKSKDLVCDGTDIVDGVMDPAGAIPSGGMIDFGGTTVPTGFLACDGSNVSRATYAALFAALMRSAVVTFDNVTDKVAWNAHGLSNGDVFKFTTTGAAPTGLTAGTTYFVVSAAANAFQVAATEGGAAINFTTNGTGVLTGIHAPWGDGDGATTFTLPDSRRRASMGRGGSATSTVGARLGATGGSETHTLVTGEMPAHTHSSPSWINNASPPTVGYQSGASVDARVDGAMGSTGGGGAHNNVQPVLVVTKIIKT